MELLNLGSGRLGLLSALSPPAKYSSITFSSAGGGVCHGSLRERVRGPPTWPSYHSGSMLFEILKR